jgi:glycosyltransferase involved in cell wall biosynthesis
VLNSALYLTGLSSLILVVLAGTSLMLGRRQLKYLKDEPFSYPTKPLRVSIVMAARNEERDIETAVASLLAQDYPNLEIIVVNDRYTDTTGAILDRMVERRAQKMDRGFNVIHLTELPSGWLGKNYAQLAGAERSSGTVILFTDADVYMAPTTVSRAVSVMESGRIDHLVVIPEVTAKRWLLKAFITSFAIMFLLYARPWRVRQPDSMAHIGVGAFNMVRRRAYLAAGTHRAIAMRPDDDMKLGKIIKQAGYQQDVRLGHGLVSLEWYPSWTALVNGLEKNMFSGFAYSVPRLVFASLACFGVIVLPFAVLPFSEGSILYINAAAASVICLLYADVSPYGAISRLQGPLFPVMILLLLYICWRSAMLALVNGGIEWRGTRYPLSGLRANKL